VQLQWAFVLFLRLFAREDESVCGVPRLRAHSRIISHY
jgi:hypothetical protein